MPLSASSASSAAGQAGHGGVVEFVNGFALKVEVQLGDIALQALYRELVTLVDHIDILFRLWVWRGAAHRVAVTPRGAVIVQRVKLAEGNHKFAVNTSRRISAAAAALKCRGLFGDSGSAGVRVSVCLGVMLPIGRVSLAVRCHARAAARAGVMLCSARVLVQNPVRLHFRLQSLAADRPRRLPAAAGSCAVVPPRWSSHR